MIDRPLNLLLWRGWRPSYAFPATFSCLDSQAIGGTCCQLLWHARALAQMGHRVQVLGMTSTNVTEEGIEFLGASDRPGQEKLLSSSTVAKPDVIFLEGSFDGASFLKTMFPGIKTVHIGQNLDRYGTSRAFDYSQWIDLYAMVGIGQLANYSVRYPRLRHKFCLIRNIVPLNSIYQELRPLSELHKVVWVGNWRKKGLRQWAETMEKVMRRHPSVRWVLCVPKHGMTDQSLPRYIFAGLQIPRENVSIVHLPLAFLARELGSAQVVLVSLGNECGPISILDAHAMGRPVLSGNDVVYKFANPEGTGIRVTTAVERYNALCSLLERVSLCDSLGKMGRQFVTMHYSEEKQRDDIVRVLQYLRIYDELGTLTAHRAPSEIENCLSEYSDKLKRKALLVRH